MSTKKKKTKPEVKLPSKLSAVIEVAVKDLRAVERSKQYEVDMGLWHEPGYAEPGQKVTKCTVCFAGSVMAKTLNQPLDKEVSDPSFAFNDFNSSRLSALDNLRSGDIERSLSYIGRPLPFGVSSDVDMPSYEYDPEGFKSNMLKVARLLKAVGE